MRGLAGRLGKLEKAVSCDLAAAFCWIDQDEGTDTALARHYGACPADKGNGRLIYLIGWEQSQGEAA